MRGASCARAAYRRGRPVTKPQGRMGEDPEWRGGPHSVNVVPIVRDAGVVQANQVVGSSELSQEAEMRS